MRILILGATGMLGHKLWQLWNSQFDTYVTWRYGSDYHNRYPIFDPLHTLNYVSAQDFDSVINAIASTKPSVLVNCIGIVKQSELAKNYISSISINSLFPHRLAKFCQASGIRLIHLSTDCVFSGNEGYYNEKDIPNAQDLYGRTKLLGEVDGEGCLTIRTSIIGRELETSQGLVEWFLNQDGKSVKGFTKAIFSGFTTIALAKIIQDIITNHPKLFGVFHIASTPISKYELLTIIKSAYNLTIDIKADEKLICDRSLNATKFNQATEFIPPDWNTMIMQMHQDSRSYNQLRGNHAI